MLNYKFQRFTGLNVSEEGIIKASLTSFGNEDSYGDIIKEGALDNWLENNSDLVGLWSHRTADIIGEWKDIEIENDLVTGELHLLRGIQRAEEAITLIKGELLEGVSIGFSAKEYSWAKRSNGWYGINFYEIELHEASLVLHPANEKAVVTDLRTAKGEMDIRKVERLLVYNGLKREEARDVISPYLSGVEGQRINQERAKEQEEDGLFSKLTDFLQDFRA